MQRSVYLGSDQAKCAGRRLSCPRADRCARNLVDAHRGRPMTDYTTAGINAWRADECRGWMDAALYREAPQRPARPVHEAPFGIC